MTWKALAVCAALVVAGCGSKTEHPSLGTELHKVRAGDLDVVLLAPGSSLKVGKETFTLEFRRAGDTSLVDVGTVKVNATMAMAGMPPMLANAVAQPSGTAGRYTVESQLTMTGTWTFGVEWQGPAGTGNAKLAAPAQ